MDYPFSCSSSPKGGGGGGGGGGGSSPASSSTSHNMASTSSSFVTRRNLSASASAGPVPYEELLVQRFQNLWPENDGDVQYRDLGRNQINGDGDVQYRDLGRNQINGGGIQHEQRFQHMGSSSSSTNPYMGSSSATNQTNGIQHEQKFQHMGSSSSTNPYMGSSINQTNGVQEQRFQYMGSSTSSLTNPYMGSSTSSLTNPYMGTSTSSLTNPYMGSCSSTSSSHYPEDEFQRRYIDRRRPITTRAQLIAALASIKGGTSMNSYNDNVGNNYLSSMNYNSLDHLVPLDSISRVPLDSMSRVPMSSMNYQKSNGFTLEDQITRSLGYVDDQDLDMRNLTFKLIDSKGWPMEKVLQIVYDDPSLLDEIEPNDIVMVAELKLGSLYLQKILKDQDPFYFNKIFYATLEDTIRLMTNSEGTYVIRKLHSLCDASHMEEVVHRITSRPDDLKYAAKNEAGADTLMKLIRVLKSTYQLFLKSVLDPLTTEICIDIMRSKPGSNLFKSCLKYLTTQQNQRLHSWVVAHCIDLATDDSGYFSLIALIENTPNPFKRELLLKISDQALCLSKDSKGNYVIQAILKLRIPEVDEMICMKLIGKYAFLSMDKCASNVVEKCIMSSGMDYPIIELIYSRKLQLLSQDSMGNYVVQKALDVTQQLERFDLYDRLVGEIQPYLKELQHHPIGRNVFRLINKRKVIMGKFVQCPIPM